MIVRSVLNVLLLLASVFLVSCTSQIPVATNYPYTEQQKMQAAHHWEVLADEVVGQMQEKGRVSKAMPLFVIPRFYCPDKESRTVYKDRRALIKADESDRLVTIPFKRAYLNYLTTKLVEADYNIVDSKKRAGQVMIFDIQVVKHAKRPVRSPDVISKLGRYLAGAADGAYIDVEASEYEAVITTSVKRGAEYIMNHTGTYYINTPPWDGNYALQGKIMEVVSQ